ncbi:MAG: von Willebrand factor type A domain-containing protein [Sphingobacteriales bacterium]|nr:von Willebrand factor type A domain-containing protein [Sphingobacteriales bacterium]
MQRPLKQTALLIGLLCLFTTASAQYYLRGEIRDENNTPLQNVRIVLRSTGYPHASGMGGAFGITTSNKVDSLDLTLEGYEPLSVMVKTTEYQKIVMKMLPYTASIQKQYLVSFTTSLSGMITRKMFVADETYSPLVENGFVKTDDSPVTGITLNINRASYSNIRRFINMNSPVPEDAVRIEEMLNYFNFNYTPPGGDSIFTLRSQLSSCPWNAGNELLFVQVASKKLNLDNVPPSNLVFLVDVSGSMDMPNRLPLLKSSFRKLVENLRAVDTVSIVVYGGVTGVMLPPTSGGDKEKILQAIEDLSAGGFTPGEAGIRQAYRLAHNSFIKDGNNRVILATDGDFNVGETGEKELEALITEMKRGGIYLTCLGVGMGNYKDSKIEVLAKKGNGNFAYLDDEREGEKVLVKELTQTLYAVADNVSMHVRFNANVVKEYRLIGFDNKRSALSDTTSTLEGGEIGSGHSVMAVFELTPVHENDGISPIPGQKSVATVTINYCDPGKKTKMQHEHECNYNYKPLDSLNSQLRFAASVCLFGGFLHSSPYVKNASWDDLISLTKASMDSTDPLQTEFLELVTKSKKIYQPSKKRKRRHDL